MKTVCDLCFHRCALAEGQTGLCRARVSRGGQIVPLNYGRLTALALDPIEKKPLRRFHPGSMILSAGSFGCNLHCPFCQNAEIAAAGTESFTRECSPEQLVQTALDLRARGNIGVAYTYNEPLVGYEYVRDCAGLVHRAGMVNVLVTNGTIEAKPWRPKAATSKSPPWWCRAKTIQTRRWSPWPGGWLRSTLKSPSMSPAFSRVTGCRTGRPPRWTPCITWPMWPGNSCGTSTPATAELQTTGGA